MYVGSKPFDVTRPCSSKGREPNRYTRAELQTLARNYGVEHEKKTMDELCVLLTRKRAEELGIENEGRTVVELRKLISKSAQKSPRGEKESKSQKKEQKSPRAERKSPKKKKSPKGEKERKSPKKQEKSPRNEIMRKALSQLIPIFERCSKCYEPEYFSQHTARCVRCSLLYNKNSLGKAADEKKLKELKRSQWESDWKHVVAQSLTRVNTIADPEEISAFQNASTWLSRKGLQKQVLSATDILYLNWLLLGSPSEGTIYVGRGQEAESILHPERFKPQKHGFRESISQIQLDPDQRVRRLTILSPEDSEIKDTILGVFEEFTQTSRGEVYRVGPKEGRRLINNSILDLLVKTDRISDEDLEKGLAGIESKNQLPLPTLNAFGKLLWLSYNLNYDLGPSPSLVPELMERWIDFANDLLLGDPGSPRILDSYAWMLAEIERIHPFIAANGRTGREILNYLFLLTGYPPLILRNQAMAKKYDHAIAEASTNYFLKFTAPAFESKGVDFLPILGNPTDVPKGKSVVDSQFASDSGLPYERRWYSPVTKFLDEYYSRLAPEEDRESFPLLM
jgi:hypothetical protein